MTIAALPFPKCGHRYCAPFQCRFQDAPRVVPYFTPRGHSYFYDLFMASQTEPHESAFDGRLDDLRADPDYRREDYESRHAHDTPVDEFIDDPRRGQAAGINRDNRGRQ